MTVIQLKLLLSGDVELNPGPPKRAPKAPEKAKEPPKEENNVGALETKVKILKIVRKLLKMNDYFNLLMLECTKLCAFYKSKLKDAAFTH